jgi:hypothetical protein
MNVAGWFTDLRYASRHPSARAGFWAGLTAMVLVAAAMVYWLPAKRADWALNDELAAKRRAFVQMQQADDLLRRYELAHKAVPRLERKLEQSASQAQLVESLARLARQHSVRVVGETYDEGRSAGGQTLLLAELTVQGNYLSLRDLLRDLPSLPMWIEVQEVRLEDVRGAAQIKGRIRIATWRRAPAGDPKAP